MVGGAFPDFEFDPESDQPSYSLFMERIHPEDRGQLEEFLRRAVWDKSDGHHRLEAGRGNFGTGYRRVAKILLCGSGNSAGDGHGEQIAIAREREMLVQQ